VSDYTKGVYACDATSVYLSNFYTRSSNNGQTWTAPMRLNGKYHADRVTLVSSGSNIVTFFMSQKHYWGCPGGSTFNTNESRFVYVRRSTGNGIAGTWGAATKLGGQTTNSRGDYLYSASDGALVVVATTNTANGKIWLWRSADGGATFSAAPITVGTTTATDNVSGYVGGFSGLPAVAVHGSTVIVSYVADVAGQVVAKVSTDGGLTFPTTQILQASGGNANNGYVQADDRTGDNRLAFSWTTSTGAFLQIYTVGTGWGTKRTITAFPDTAPAVGTLYNKGGEGAVIALGSGTTVGIALSECNTANGNTCNSPDLLDAKARSQLVWRESSNNGVSWGTPEVIKAPGTAKGSYLNNYGDALYLASGKPFVVWNAHNSAYTAYTNQIRVGN
jgi:hypothetical protein